MPFADLFNHKTAYTPLEYEVWTQEGEEDGEDGDKVLDIDVYDADEEGDVGEEDRKRLPGHEQTMCLASATSKVDRDVLQVGLLRSVAKGAEVFNTYGEHGNAHLLANYGFTLEQNVFDQVHVPALMASAEATVGKKQVAPRVQWLRALEDAEPALAPAKRRLRARLLRAALVGYSLKRRHSAVCPLGARIFSLLAALSSAEFARLKKMAGNDALQWLQDLSDKSAAPRGGKGGGGGARGGGRGGAGAVLAAGPKAKRNTKGKMKEEDEEGEEEAAKVSTGALAADILRCSLDEEVEKWDFLLSLGDAPDAGGGGDGGSRRDGAGARGGRRGAAAGAQDGGGGGAWAFERAMVHVLKQSSLWLLTQALARL